VPSLDAIIFLHPKKSQIDVVQAVGRVMRKAEGKQYGYVILPIAVPAGKSAEEALADNKNYKVVWQVLQALSSFRYYYFHPILYINQLNFQ
jgi:predicted helicase